MGIDDSVQLAVVVLLVLAAAAYAAAGLVKSLLRRRSAAAAGPSCGSCRGCGSGKAKDKSCGCG